jgi:hypothetical protein
MLKLTVGAAGSTHDFCIHEALLTARSKFFERAMGKSWKEAKEKLVRLPEDDPRIFALYEQIVYTGRIPIFDDEVERVSSGAYNDPECDEEELCMSEYESLCQLYVWRRSYTTGTRRILQSRPSSRKSRTKLQPSATMTRALAYRAL